MNLWRQSNCFNTNKIKASSNTFLNIFVKQKMSLKHQHAQKFRINLRNFSSCLVAAEKEPIISINSVKSNFIFSLVSDIKFFIKSIVRYEYYSFVVWKRGEKLNVFTDWFFVYRPISYLNIVLKQFEEKHTVRSRKINLLMSPKMVSRFFAASKWSNRCRTKSVDHF